MVMIISGTGGAQSFMPVILPEPRSQHPASFQLTGIAKTFQPHVEIHHTSTRLPATGLARDLLGIQRPVRRNWTGEVNSVGV